LKTTLASLEKVREIFADDWAAKADLYDEWYETGEGDEEVIAENSWVAEKKLEEIDRTILLLEALAGA
jgi:hypothetical protein